MNTYAYLFAAAFVLVGTAPAHAQTGAVLDTYGSASLVQVGADAGIDTDVSIDIFDAATTTAATTSLSAKTETQVIAELAVEDDRIEDVRTDASSIDVTYRVDGKFLGIVRSSLPVTVEVEREGSVDLSYPWYAFLYSGRPADLETKLTAAARAQGEWSADTFTSEKRAEIIANIYSALRESVGLGATADVTW